MSTENKNPLEFQTGIDERETLVIREGRFFEPYKKELKEIFTALNREDKWSDDPADMLDYVRSGWIGGEHGNSETKDQFTPEEVAAVMPILERIGFAGELLPDPDAIYDQSLVVGGTTTANYRRRELTTAARHQGTQLGTEIWLVGQRPRVKLDGSGEELLGVEGRFGGNDISDNPWAAHARRVIEASEGAFTNPTDHDKQNDWLFTETDTARIALLKQNDGSKKGNLSPHRIDLNLIKATGMEEKLLNPVKPINGAPARDTISYHFEDDGHETVLLYAPAVERRNGDKIIDPRPTTKSVTREWLTQIPPEKGAKVLYVTGNPHTLRTAQDTFQILREMGREDIQLEIAGTTPVANAPIQTYLGEIGRLIDIDYKRNYSPAETK
ncbi:MAG: hypothetical protein WAR37_04815 [Candidatus Microsaccharimonas sp.]